jgi:hypothetical protein
MEEGKTLVEVLTGLKPDIPEPPPMDPALGDKTPAYMEWYRQHHPDEYERKYRGRRTHLTKNINPHITGEDVPDTHFGEDPKEEQK